ncbi:MAG: S8 family serine peptidase [Clostridia bacterium]
MYGTKTGTSMASPQIAGAAALVKQYLRDQCPELSEGEIHARTNQLLLSTAIPCREDNGTEYSPRKQGAGLVNVGNALGTEAYLSVESPKRAEAQGGTVG